MTVLQESAPTRQAPPAARRGIVVVHGSRQHWLMRAVLVVLAVLFLVWAANLAPFRVGQMTNVFVIAIAIAGLNLVTGYTGLLSIGHSAFFGLGAYTTGILVTRYELAPLATVPVAIVLGFAVGLAVGLPSLRIKGLYLALVTLAVGVSFPEIVRRAEDLTGGAAGLVIRSRFLAPPEWTGLVRAERGLWMFWLSALVLVVVMVLARSIVRSRFGLAMQAVRDNEIAAAANGVDVARTKILVFGVSGAITALAGALFAQYVGALSPDGSFTLLKSIELITGLVLGGVATTAGPLVGAFAVVFLPQLTGSFSTGPLSGVVFGVVLIAIVFLMPEGIVGRATIWLRRVLTILPADHPDVTRRSSPPS
ncbi:branched-chain amino acid ABC transporter permease [Janibacter melonis]|uniref:Branched-chain amino acid ABC transporter permease n=1 Tax=Janibacter melonis TaxID=262209 RepID=A0A5P8FPN8_9MICO|nr:branched-chain amino acid ABC transporter permease [Janibacter melonis]MCB5991929.1 branched-chain amino acid ABC transporter permease [Janibacter melonis]QFQ31546.2 branched-chain amino acid ABC transporter permease [Janibacter melonis]